MNRQQRRMLARKKDFEARHWKEIEDRQNQVDDRTLEIFMVGLALALNSLYGWQHRGISNVISETNYQICRLNSGITFEELTKELEKKTGIVFRLRHEDMPERKP